MTEPADEPRNPDPPQPPGTPDPPDLDVDVEQFMTDQERAAEPDTDGQQVEPS
jgi:hypothetical protein